MNARPPLASLFAALLPLPLALAAPVADLPFEELARRSLVAHSAEASSPEDLDLAALFAAAYVTADLGLFELAMPVHSLQDRRWADTYRDVAVALLDAQKRWLEHVDPGGERAAEARSDLEALRRWVAKWSAADLRGAGSKPARDALALLGAREDVARVSERLKLAMLAGAGLPELPEGCLPVQLVLAPTRADFVELLALAGWARPELREIFWQPGVEGWLQFSVDDRKVIALEYVANGRAPDDYAAGTPMDQRTTTGVQQQVVQLALLRLIDVYYGSGMPSVLGKGLVMNLVIDQFGEIQTRVDGDLSSKETQEREIFVPGGRSEGGELPMNVAESRWRTEGGKDRFLRILRQVQKSGRSAREGSRNDLARFQLQTPSESERVIFSAPVLGSAAEDNPPPPESVQADYLEFLRAYQCGFVHWLQRAAGGSRKASERAFAELLAALADPSRGQSAEELVAEVYGAPLSDADCSPATLEGRFLRWLSTQR